MTEFPSLAEVLADHISEAIIEAAQLREGIGGPSTYEVIQRHAAAAQAAWCEACTISTVEELDALPDGVIVRDRIGDAWTKGGSRYGLERTWWRAADGDEPHAASAIELDAWLVWHPDGLRP